jgi:hypothetical protein
MRWKRLYWLLEGMFFPVSTDFSTEAECSNVLVSLCQKRPWRWTRRYVCLWTPCSLMLLWSPKGVKARIPRPQDHVHSWGYRKKSSPAFHGCQHPLAYGHITPVLKARIINSLSALSSHCLLCECLCGIMWSPSALLLRGHLWLHLGSTFIIRMSCPLTTLNWLTSAKASFFQRRWHSYQGLGPGNLWIEGVFSLLHRPPTCTK